MSGLDAPNTPNSSESTDAHPSEDYVAPQVITSYSIRELRGAAARNAAS